MPAILCTSILASAALFTALPARASDHQDAPNLAGHEGVDINDAYFFLDPNDNTKVVIAMTVHGFIVPSEAVNSAIFDPAGLFEFDLVHNNDTAPYKKIHVTFTPKTSPAAPQMAHVEILAFSPKGQVLPARISFDAPTTVASLSGSAPAQVVTTEPDGIKFFAGEVKDPFFFDIPAFSRFVASVKAGTPDPTVFNRGRDSFAGYNTLAIALSIPKQLLTAGATVLGVSAVTYEKEHIIGPEGGLILSGNYHQIDRAATPAVNVALIPFAKKNLYNQATPKEDAAGKFAADIVASLKLFGTDAAHIDALAGIAVAHGDYLRLNLGLVNSGTQGGLNSGSGFPNGRRLSDDVIDTILTVIHNGSPLGDNVNASNVPPQDSFPFFALPMQPQTPGVIDDGTRN